jgi:hypothetical protein
MTRATFLASEARRSVEALAQSLYEASDPAGVPWARRHPVIREPWLHLAQRQLAKTGPAAWTGSPPLPIP